MSLVQEEYLKEINRTLIAILKELRDINSGVNKAEVPTDVSK